MRNVRIAIVGLTFLVAVLAFLMGGSTPQAFHSGGVAECNGCHSMHAPKATSYLLAGSDPSSTCLTCHQKSGDTGPSSYHVSTADADMPKGTAPLHRSPGGDFGWLKKTYTFTERGSSVTEAGQSHGHNIVAADNGYVADTDHATAPGGGTFSATDLACNSCHDPHGKYRRDTTGNIATTGKAIYASGSYWDTAATGANEPTTDYAVGVYRLLAGKGYDKADFPGVPAAKAPKTYNQTELTNQVRVAYGVKTTQGHATWSNWCATCHPNMHSTGNTVHPVDTGLSDVMDNYNKYVKSGDMTGVAGTSYSSLVPFATNSGDYTVLGPLAGNASPTYAGPNSSDQVMCLSCHRAHASGFPSMLRWSMENEFMVKAGVYEVANRGRATAVYGASVTEAGAGYYDRPVTQFAGYQRVLCNKCHAKD